MYDWDANFPVVRTRPPGRGGGLELLETDANGIALYFNESIALVVQSVSVHSVLPVQTSEGIDPALTSRKKMKSRINLA